MTRLAVAALAMAVCAPAFAQAPSASEQTAFIGRAREVALQYSDMLPNFVCTETVHRSFGDSGQVRQRDTLTVQLTYSQKHESYKPIVGGKPVDRDLEDLGGAFFAGEFGSALRRIFEPDSAAAFHWEKSASEHGARVWVYSYRIDRGHSQYALVLGVGKDQVKVIAGFHGMLHIAADAAMVLRLTMEADDIPSTFPIRKSSHEVDYEYRSVAGRQYLLPARADMRMLYWPNRALGQSPVSRMMDFENEVDFGAYRKFAVDSAIDFGDGKP